MSLITTCPECRTAFLIQPEDLAAHRGDVRCGKCSHLFNALEHLSKSDPTPDQVQLFTDPEPTVAPTGQTVSHPDVISGTDEDILSLVSTTEIDFVLEAELEQPLSEIALDEVTDVSSSTEKGSHYPILVDPELDVKADVETTATEPEPNIVHSFAREIEPDAFSQTSSHTPHLTGIWVVTGLLLFLSAIAQTLYFMRTDLSVRVPQIKPYLTQACSYLNCTVPLPRKIDLIVVDDSSLQEDTDHTGVILFRSTLINRAHFTQAYPLLELTLTDLTDHAIMRRVFTPAEYLPKDTSVDNGLQADSEMQVKLALSAENIKAAGYRVFISY